MDAKRTGKTSQAWGWIAARDRRAFRPQPYGSRLLLVGTAVLVMFGSIATFDVATAAASNTITIRGGTSCKNHGVVGVFVASSKGGSKFASWTKASPGGWSAAFSTSI